MSIVTKKDIQDILLPGRDLYEYEHLEIRTLTNGYEISWKQMYLPPELNFATLKKLSLLFKTDEVDIDNYSQRGCDTCDFGSSYGHTIQITGTPLKYYEEGPYG